MSKLKIIKFNENYRKLHGQKNGSFGCSIFGGKWWRIFEQVSRFYRV